MRQQRLNTTILSAQLSGYSHYTWKNFCSVLNQYLRFCNESQLSPFPASVKALNGFAIITSLRVKSPRTVTNYLPSLKTLHHLFDLPMKNFSDFGIRLTIRGLNKTMLHVFQCKRPITIDTLHSFTNILLSGDHINNVSLLACILTGFFIQPTADVTKPIPFTSSIITSFISLLPMGYCPQCFLHQKSPVSR